MLLLLEAARGVLSSSGEMYDPERYEMYVLPEENFQCQFSMGLGDTALPASMLQSRTHLQL